MAYSLALAVGQAGLVHLAGEGFLADLAAGQVTEGATGLFGAGLGGCFDPRCQALGERAEVLDENATGVEIGFHDGRLEEVPQRAAQPQTIEAAQNSCNTLSKSSHKDRLDVSLDGRGWLFHELLFYPKGWR